MKKNTIWKYPLPLRVAGPIAEIGRFTLSLPVDARPLSVGLQGEDPMLWVLVDGSVPLTDHAFVLAGTGQVVEFVGNGPVFLGTFQVGWFVGHLFYLGMVRDL